MNAAQMIFPAPGAARAVNRRDKLQNRPGDAAGTVRSAHDPSLSVIHPESEVFRFNAVQETSVYQSEYMDTLNRLWKENDQISSFRYFLDIAYMRFDTSVKTKPEVTVLGPDVPEELIYAAGARPYWLLGGSLGSVAWSDDLVPRDADPVSRSVLGFIHQPDGPDFSDSLFIVPLTSDSMRKIAYELKNDGRKLCLLDVPPERSDCWALEKWQTQMIRMMAAVAEHTKTHVTRRRVVNCRKMVVRARKTLAAFLELSREKETIFTASARMLVAGSYYYADDLRDWTEHLRMLMEELREQSARILPEDDHPGVLLMGSPVLFPNYKIPLLIHEIGLDIRAVADETALKLEETDTKRIFGGGRDKVIRAIARQRYQHDASSAFVHNDALYHHVQSLLKRGDIEGVVYHVLKGQIEYDFELERFESLFAAHGIPVFRLETDYQYQDVEQLRIRMEAFSEMLRQNRYRKGK